MEEVISVEKLSKRESIAYSKDPTTGLWYTFQIRHHPKSETCRVISSCSIPMEYLKLLTIVYVRDKAGYFLVTADDILKERLNVSERNRYDPRGENTETEIAAKGENHPGSIKPLGGREERDARLLHQEQVLALRGI